MINIKDAIALIYIHICIMQIIKLHIIKKTSAQYFYVTIYYTII